MNLRTFIIFVVIFMLIAGGVVFSRVVENYAEENKDIWQVKKSDVAANAEVNPYESSN